MKKRTAFCLALMVLSDWMVSASGASGGQGSPEEDLRKSRRDFVAAMNSGDPERILGFADADVVFLTHKEKVLEGCETFGARLREHFGKMRERGISLELEMHTTRLEYSGDLAYELGRYSMVHRLRDGVAKSSRGKFVDVWKRQPDGQWRIIVHAPSDDPAEEGAKAGPKEARQHE